MYILRRVRVVQAAGAVHQLIFPDFIKFSIFQFFAFLPSFR